MQEKSLQTQLSVYTSDSNQERRADETHINCKKLAEKHAKNLSSIPGFVPPSGDIGVLCVRSFIDTPAMVLSIVLNVRRMVVSSATNTIGALFFLSPICPSVSLYAALSRLAFALSGTWIRVRKTYLFNFVVSQNPE